MNRNNLLIIFVKAPHTGRIKTRLAKFLPKEVVRNIYQCMVEDLLDHLKNTDRFDIRIFFYPQDAYLEIKNWLGAEWNFVPQAGGDLGNKMIEAFKGAFSDGYRKVVLIGSDLPLLNEDCILEAFAQLDNHKAVLGPSTDGGYYLIGLRTSQPKLFEDIDWSTDKVLQKTLENARDNNISAFLLKEENDIDHYEDLKILWECVDNNTLAQQIPKTYQMLKSIFVP